VTQGTADREILGSGLVFGAVYTIYRVVECDGHRLVKLRNPPDYGAGHGEWKGDWSDDSPLWTKRMKSKLEWADADDGTFWMSFDDFCMAFRSLYVCRYYDPARWNTYTMAGKWSLEDKTAQGLPSVHNLQCELERNPQYALIIERPTDVCIKLSQTQNGVALQTAPHPISVVLANPGGGKKSIRLREMNRKTVISTSGDAVEEIERVCYAELRPGAYTILAATYMPEMESPFELKVVSNFPVRLWQIWPPPWKEGEKPMTLAEKIKAKAADATRAAANSLKRKITKELAKKGVDSSYVLEKVTGESAAETKAAEEGHDAALEAARKSKLADECKWVKQWDASAGAEYYYNTETGVAVWEEPEGYVEPTAGSSSGGGSSMPSLTLSTEDASSNDARAFVAVRNGDKNALSNLLDMGVVVSEALDDDGNSLLHAAASVGSKRICKLLMRRGAPINAANAAGESCYDAALQGGHVELAEYLKSKGAS